MHYAEHRAGGVPAEITACYAAGKDIEADYPPDKWYIEVGRTPEDGWGKIQAEAFRRGLIRERVIGSARCLFFRAAEVTAIFASNSANVVNLQMVQRDDPFGTYEVDLEVKNVAHLTRIVSALRASEAVAEAERI